MCGRSVVQVRFRGDEGIRSERNARGRDESRSFGRCEVK